MSIIESLKTIIPRVSKVSPDDAVNTPINKLVLGSENTEGDSELPGKAFGKLFEFQKKSGGGEISSSKASGSDQVSDIQQEDKIDSEDNKHGIVITPYNGVEAQSDNGVEAQSDSFNARKLLQNEFKQSVLFSSNTVSLDTDEITYAPEPGLLWVEETISLSRAAINEKNPKQFTISLDIRIIDPENKPSDSEVGVDYEIKDTFDRKGANDTILVDRKYQPELLQDVKIRDNIDVGISKSETDLVKASTNRSEQTKKNILEGDEVEEAAAAADNVTNVSNLLVKEEPSKGLVVQLESDKIATTSEIKDLKKRGMVSTVSQGIDEKNHTKSLVTELAVRLKQLAGLQPLNSKIQKTPVDRPLASALTQHRDRKSSGELKLVNGEKPVSVSPGEIKGLTLPTPKKPELLRGVSVMQGNSKGQGLGDDLAKALDEVDVLKSKGQIAEKTERINSQKLVSTSAEQEFKSAQSIVSQFSVPISKNRDSVTRFDKAGLDILTAVDPNADSDQKVELGRGISAVNRESSERSSALSPLPDNSAKGITGSAMQGSMNSLRDIQTHLHRQVLGQLWKISKINETRAVIELEPRELGKVIVSLEMAKGQDGLKLVLHTETAQAANALQQDMHKLRQLYADFGINLQNFHTTQDNKRGRDHAGRNVSMENSISKTENTIEEKNTVYNKQDTGQLNIIA